MKKLLPDVQVIDLSSEDHQQDEESAPFIMKQQQQQQQQQNDDDSTLSQQPPICRQFWKAGNYEVPQKRPLLHKNERNYLSVHPMFLHSNATSHKWVFGAIAELVDNAIDEVQNKATFVDINKISNPRDGSPALLIQDDGGGMDPEAMRHCLSFGFSKKTKCAIGQYGNGFKASTMRLGADVIVFSRHNKMRTPTQSVGLLSYSFLRRTSHDKIVVPIVDYEFNASTEAFRPILPHGMEHFCSNLSTLLQWSPYSTEQELTKQFDDIGNQGTKIVIYNLWLNDDGHMELDFDSDVEDIQITGGPKLFQVGDKLKPIFEQHIANVYRYSLRVYLSILYLKVPQCFKLKLRRRVVEQHNIASDLKFPQFILYRPQTGGKNEIKDSVITTIGFLKEAPNVNIHGFNIYHRNRLILPFWRVLKNVTNSNGRGIVGVLEANYIEPTHNKQDFEKTSPFQKLEDRLKQMTLEYWRLHCELIGYQIKKSSSAPPSHEIHSGSRSSSDELMLSYHSSPLIESSGAVPVGSSQDVLSPTACVTATTHRESTDINQIKTPQRVSTKRKRHNPSLGLEHAQAFAADMQHTIEEQPYHTTGNQVQGEHVTSLMQENKKLCNQLSELEKNVEGFYLKVEQLQSELTEVQWEYTRLLEEAKSMDIINEWRYLMGY